MSSKEILGDLLRRTTDIEDTLGGTLTPSKMVATNASSVLVSSEIVAGAGITVTPTGVADRTIAVTSLPVVTVSSNVTVASTAGTPWNLTYSLYRQGVKRYLKISAPNVALVSLVYHSWPLVLAAEDLPVLGSANIFTPSMYTQLDGWNLFHSIGIDGTTLGLALVTVQANGTLGPYAVGSYPAGSASLEIFDTVFEWVADLSLV